MNEKPYDNRQCAICKYKVLVEFHLSCAQNEDVNTYRYRDMFRCPSFREAGSSEYITCSVCGKTSLFKPVDEINPATFKCFDCWKKEKP